MISQLKRDMLLESTKHFPINTTLNVSNLVITFACWIMCFVCRLFQPENPFSEVDSSSRCGSNGGAELYDPCFLLPLLTQQLDPSK